MASTSTSTSASTSSGNTEHDHDNEHRHAYEQIVVSSSTSTTPSLETLFSSCFNCCSFFLSLCSTRSHPNAFQEEAVPSPSDTHAFDQVVPSTSTSARSTVMPQRKLPYDVFVNHRGPDVKHTLAATLYKTLTGMGLRVFLDNEELAFGDFLPIDIEEAMRSASLHIAIFSKNYAQSSWCLAELLFMLKTGTQIVPVFYHVQPDDVRYAKGVYAEAFSRHMKKGRYTLEKLQEWKNALNSVSYNVGFVHNDDDEGILMKKIVGSVLKVIKNVPFVVANHPIGLDEAVQDFECTTLQSAENHNNVQIVGIWGMGGSGKTTLAKHLYNNKYKYMDKSSFLLDVRDAASKSKLHEKQKKLLQDLGLSGVSIDNVEEGQGILANRLRSIRVLIILDDVDSVDQLNALVPKKDSLGLGSLIVVTSREFEVLGCWGISSIYKMKPLYQPNAKQLFCWHAFLQPSPRQGFEDLVEKFLNVCQGLPLSLKVFGAQLYGISNKDCWEIQLQKISRILPKDIKERLKVSYDALDDEEKQIFLDIACLFIGENTSSAIATWDGLGWNGQHSWEQLLNKCLVEVNDDSSDGGDVSIRMHDHLRDLGREIANHQSPIRIWSPEQIINVGNEVRGFSIRGILARAAESTNENVEFPQCSQDGKLIFKASGVNYSLEPSSLGLKIFHTRGNYYNHVIGDLSRELVWLRWFDIEQRNLQSLSSLKNLRVLELYDKQNGEHHLEELWDADINTPIQLRELSIFCSKFQRFPKSIGCLQHLKKISIIGDEMRSLPDEFCLLQSLEHLRLGGSELSSLPRSFGDLRKLKHLHFSDCRKLRKLPLSFKKLALLQYLSLNNCYELTLESDSLENMTRLVCLEINGSKQLEELPRHVTNQACLTRLGCGIERLKELPVNIGQLSKLRRMVISSRLLTSLPTCIGDLSSLISLEISECHMLECLPESIGDLSSLTSLKIFKCHKLECLPESIGDLSSLTYLKIFKCHKLECLPESIGDLSSLTSLEISECHKLECLPKSFGQLINLETLDISVCPISELDLGAGLFTCLKALELYSTDVVKISISRDSPLEWLQIYNNSHLKEIEALPNTLQHIYLKRCPKLDVLPSFAQLGCLEVFEIKGCYGVKKIPGLEHCRAMERLRRVKVQAISRSGFEGFIQSMKKCPKEEMTVCARAVPDAATLVNSFVNSFPNLSVVDSFANQKMDSDPFLKLPSTARCTLLCFVVNCESSKNALFIKLRENESFIYRVNKVELEEGRWVYTTLFTQHYAFHSVISDRRRRGCVRQLHICDRVGGEVEKGVVVMGEEESVWEAFTHLCVVLTN